MNSFTSPAKKLILLVLAVASSAVAHASILATASISDTQISPGDYQYDLTLDNTGTTTIGTFWYSWVPGAGFLSAAPTNVVTPTGWTDTITNGGGAVRWVTTTNLLNPGDSLTGFMFDSTETPTQMQGIFDGAGTGSGDPITTSFVYIAAPLADPGDQLVASFSQTSQTPEPSSGLLVLTGLALAGISVGARRLRNV